MFPILGLFLASPALPKILDFIKPLNGTRDLIYLYETEYFVDQREYYLPILLHYYLSVPISVGGIVFFDNMLGTFIHHECAMLEILSLYLQRTVIKLDQTNEALNYGAFTMGSIFHLFYSSFQGQILITQITHAIGITSQQLPSETSEYNSAEKYQTFHRECWKIVHLIDGHLQYYITSL
ncbi:Protein of unknown function [Cotesia congregata]|uniref:Uncharacterized protein n=1 Tax=Cotesia congregata TaxID=51543 RepID=A0A8J2MRT7_COTCN|nr:Protein of unknown function [Cotesia congregata]